MRQFCLLLDQKDIIFKNGKKILKKKECEQECENSVISSLFAAVSTRQPWLQHKTFGFPRKTSIEFIWMLCRVRSMYFENGRFETFASKKVLKPDILQPDVLKAWRFVKFCGCTRKTVVDC